MTYPECVICGGPNDMGEVCKRCAVENRESTMAGFFESGESTPYEEYGFDHPSDAEPSDDE